MRLIDGDKLLEIIAEQERWNVPDFVYESIKNAPTIDAEPVIRCKDCNFCGEIDENGWHCCENFGVGMPKNGFCSDAERREDEDAD